MLFIESTFDSFHCCSGVFVNLTVKHLYLFSYTRLLSIFKNMGVSLICSLYTEQDKWQGILGKGNM